jgi:hypothetical protein
MSRPPHKARRQGSLAVAFASVWFPLSVSAAPPIAASKPTPATTTEAGSDESTDSEAAPLAKPKWINRRPL